MAARLAWRAVELALIRGASAFCNAGGISAYAFAGMEPASCLASACEDLCAARHRATARGSGRQDRGKAPGRPLWPSRPSAPYGLARRWLRGFIHFFSYHLILARQSTRKARAAGFELVVRPTVFHPRYFLTSEYFAGFIDRLDLKGKSVAEVGTGSGVLSLAAARAGAARVVAIDINPNAALSAGDNARLNGLADRVFPLCSNLFSGVAPRPLFDVILSSPPSFAGEPRDVADRAWVAGPGYRDIAQLFAAGARAAEARRPLLHAALVRLRPRPARPADRAKPAFPRASSASARSCSSRSSSTS